MATRPLGSRASSGGDEQWQWHRHRNEDESTAGFSNRFKEMMKDPKSQERLSQLGKVAQQIAKDPKTRAQLDKAMEKA
jgi:hypothetical protein